MKKSRSFEVISNHLVDIAIMIEAAEQSEAPIIDVTVAIFQLGEIQKELDIHRGSYLLT